MYFKVGTYAAKVLSLSAGGVILHKPEDEGWELVTTQSARSRGRNKLSSSNTRVAKVSGSVDGTNLSGMTAG